MIALIVAALLGAQNVGEHHWDAEQVNLYLLDSLMSESISSTEPEDPFMQPAPSPVNGQAIRFYLPVAMKASGAGYSAQHWEYDREQRVLTVTFLPRRFNSGVAFFDEGAHRPMIPVTSRLDGFVTLHEVLNEEVRRMVTSMGVEFDATVIEEVTLGVAAHSPDHRSPLPHNANGRSEFYEYSIRIDPEDARQLTEGLVLVVEARAADWRPGAAYLCGTTYHRATTIGRRQISGDVCVLTVNYESITLMDGAGSALHSWR